MQGTAASSCLLRQRRACVRFGHANTGWQRVGASCRCASTAASSCSFYPLRALQAAASSNGMLTAPAPLPHHRSSVNEHMEELYLESLRAFAEVMAQERGEEP